MAPARWLIVAAPLLAAGCQSPKPPALPTGQPAAPQQPARQYPPRMVLDLGDSVCMELTLIPAGSFLMGSGPRQQDREPDEGPVRRVTITKPFYMGVCEVTQEQYEAIVGSNPSHFKGRRHPVDGIWWSDAVQFCQKLSQQVGRPVRLPTEAEWEYACRAGTTTRYSFGDAYADLPRYANCQQWPALPAGADSQEPNGTIDVGSLAPNGWGLHDMHGNVFEWCRDWYRDSYKNLTDTDPVGAPSGAYHVTRGGGWASPPWKCRSAYRNRFTACGRFNDQIGFRVVVPTD